MTSADATSTRVVSDTGTTRIQVESTSVAFAPSAACIGGSVATAYFDTVAADTPLMVAQRLVGAATVPSADELNLNQAPYFNPAQLEYFLPDPTGTFCDPTQIDPVPSGVGLYWEVKQVDPVMARTGKASAILVAQTRVRLPSLTPPCRRVRNVNTAGEYDTAHHFYTTHDCGHTWTRVASRIWPYAERIDRPEVIADPYHTNGQREPYLYLSTDNAGNRKLLRSIDGGVTWDLITGIALGSNSPLMQVTVPPSAERSYGRLVLARCAVGTPSIPQVAWSDDFGLTFSDWVDVTYPGAAPLAERACAYFSPNWITSSPPGSPHPLRGKYSQRSSPLGITRLVDTLPTDGVRFAYPSLVADAAHASGLRQVIRVVSVRLGRFGDVGDYTLDAPGGATDGVTVEVAGVQTVDPGSGYHAIFGSFIRTEPWDFPEDPADPLSDAAILHWTEAADAGAVVSGSGLRVGYRATANNLWTAAGTYASGASATLAEIPAVCTSPGSTCEAGEYHYGSMYAVPGDVTYPLRFVVQWSEGDGIGTAGILRYNTIKVGLQ